MVAGLKLNLQDAYLSGSSKQSKKAIIITARVGSKGNVGGQGFLKVFGSNYRNTDNAYSLNFKLSTQRTANM